MMLQYPNEESNAIVGHNHHGRNETRNGWNRADNRIDDGAHGQQGRDGSDGANYHNRRPIFDGGGYNSRPQSGDRPFSGSFAGRGDIREDQRLWKNPRDNHPSDDHHHNNNYRNDQQHRSNWRRGDGHHHQHQNYHQQPDTRGARQGEQPAMNWKKGQGGGAVNDLSPSNPPKSTPSKGLVASAPTTEQVSFKVKKREVDIVAEKAVKSASTSLVAASQDHPPQQYSSTSSTSKTKSPVETKAIATTGKDTDTCSKYAIAVISSTSASSSPVPLKSTTQSPTAHTSTAAIKPKEIEGWKKPTATVVFPEEVNGVTRTKESVMVNNPSGKKRNDKEVTNPYLKIEDFDTVMVNIRKMMAKSATTATTTTSDTLQTDTGNSITSFTTAAVSIIPQSRSSSRSASECPAKKSVSDDVENWRDRPAPDVIEVHDYKARAGAQQTRNQKTGWSSLPSSKTNRFTEDSKSKSRDSAMSVDVGEVAEIEQQQQQQQKSSTKETSSDASKEIAPLIKNHIPSSVNISNSKFSQDGRRVKSASNPKSSGNLLSSDELDTTATLEHAGNIKNTIVSPDHRAVESIMRNESSVSHSLPAGYNGAVIPIAVSKDGLNHSSKQQQQVALMSSTSPAPTHHYQQQHQNHMHHQAPVMSWYPINQVWHGNGNYEIHQNHTMYPHQMQFVPIAPFQPTGSWPMTGRNTATTTSGTASTISASAVVATHTSVHDLSISSPHQHIHHKHHQMYQQPPPQQQQQVPQPHHLSHAPNIMHHPPPHHHPHPTYHHHIPVVHMVQAPANWVDKKSDQKNAKNVTHSNQQKAAAAAGGAAQNFPQQQPFTSNSSFYGATESGFVLNSFGQQQSA